MKEVRRFVQPPNEFQSDVSVSLKNSKAPCPSQVRQQGADSQSRRFNIYRNNRAVSLIESLKATYPAVNKLVGEAYFSAVARSFIDEHPPQSAVMAEYGGDFGEFIRRSPNAKNIPYVSDLAALEWARLQSYHSADAETLPIDRLLSVADPSEYDSLVFEVHPSLFQLSSRWPVGSLWSEITSPAASDADKPEIDKPEIDMKSAEHVVVVRPEYEVFVQVLPESGAVLLKHLKHGESLQEAVSSVTQKDPEFDPGVHLKGLIDLGAFCGSYLKG